MKLFQIPICLLFLLAGCKEEYIPKIKSASESILVVEGVLNSGQGPTNIRLTRTFKLDDSAQLRPETGAQLTVESSSGAQFPLYDWSGNGTYGSEQLPLDPLEKYRLHINTSDGNEYISDFISVKKPPPIDSISWARKPDGVQIYVTAHDDANATRYYKWEYEETWELRSAYYSKLVIDNGVIRDRTPDENVFFCWRNAFSNSIYVASSAKLQSDVIFMNPLLHVPQASEKMAERYSILVKQTALDKEGYEFYQLMKKNTETLGSIFDAQPSEISGNIHSISNPAELVIGYISASATEEKRIFINRRDVGQNWGFELPCESIEIPNNPDSINLYYPYLLLPYESVYFGLNIVAYKSSQPSCTDCTMRGGTTQKPDFW